MGMSNLSAAVVAGAMSFCPGTGANSNPDLPERADSVITQPSQATPEWKSIAAGLDASDKQWRFLPPEIHDRVHLLLDGIAIEGMTRKELSLQYVRGGVLVGHVSFSPSDARPFALGEGFSPRAVESANQQLKPLGSRGYDLIPEALGNYLIPEARFALSESGDFIIIFMLTPGKEALSIPQVTPLTVEVSTKEQRAEAWATALGLLKLGEAYQLPDLAAKAEQVFSALHEQYEQARDFFLRKLAQAMVCATGKSVEPYRRYLDYGRIGPDEMEQVPEPLRAQVLSLNYLTRDMPSRSALEIQAERMKNVKAPAHLIHLVTLEERAKLISPDSADIARTEIKNAMFYARSEFAKYAEPTIGNGIEIVRKFFEEDFANEYRYRDSIQGVGSGLVFRRTDCSTRALIAREMLRAMYIDAGVEIIVAQKEGRDAEGIAGHMYNIVRAPNGSTIFVDFCTSKGKDCIFDTNTHFLQRYVGDSGYSARVLVSSSDDGDVYAAILREPVMDELTAFVRAFEAEKTDLEGFLNAHPEAEELIKRLQEYSKHQDELFGTKETELWRQGTQESLRQLYGQHFSGH